MNLQHSVINNASDLAMLLKRHSPANRNQAKWDFLRDRKPYSAAGHDVLSFFNEKNEEYNTVTTPGRPLASDVAMIVRGISVRLISSIAPARAGAVLPEIVNDLVAFGNRGLVSIKVNQDEVMEDGPLCLFPDSTFVAADVAYVDSSTPAANKVGVVELARLVGRPYPLEPFTLMPDQNLHIKLLWPNGKLVLPSGKNAEVEVRLFGEKFLLR